MYTILNSFKDASGAIRYLVEIEKGNCIYLKFRGKVTEEEVQKAADKYAANLVEQKAYEALQASKQIVNLMDVEVPKVGEVCRLCSQIVSSQQAPK